MGFKENWLKEDEKCLHCGAVTKRQKGITKQNMKRLLIPRNDSTEWMINLMIIVILLLAWRFQVETQQCRAVVSNITNVCFDLAKAQSSQLNTYSGLMNATNITLSDIPNISGSLGIRR